MTAKTKLLDLSLKQFDIAKLKNMCNAKSCVNVPCVEFSVFEYALNKRKNILSVYLCAEHSKEINSYLKSLRQLAPNMILEKQVKNLTE